jgi:hypothetical protein
MIGWPAHETYVPYNPHARPFKLKLVGLCRLENGNPNESGFDKTKTNQTNIQAVVHVEAHYIA